MVIRENIAFFTCDHARTKPFLFIFASIRHFSEKAAHEIVAEKFAKLLWRRRIGRAFYGLLRSNKNNSRANFFGNVAEGLT